MPGISSLKANANANIEATITAVSTPRDVTTVRGPSRVADATLQDATGTITLTLWGGDIEKYSVGQKVRITDGWVKDFRGKLQVSMGRSGRIEIVA
ncbi:MAG TPA: OB-fold nucleic acid binding domain-containing protein [Thermoplasmata archaeon]|nr:OB-fold nucleic acid binding domain-containing protein [Thermoplasmata archaeon]